MVLNIITSFLEILYCFYLHYYLSKKMFNEKCLLKQDWNAFIFKSNNTPKSYADFSHKKGLGW